MRGRQQVYPTNECAPNRALWTREIGADMPIFRDREWAYREYAQRSQRGRGMSRGPGG